MSSFKPISEYTTRAGEVGESSKVVKMTQQEFNDDSNTKFIAGEPVVVAFYCDLPMNFKVVITDLDFCRLHEEQEGESRDLNRIYGTKHVRPITAKNHQI